MVVNRMTDRDKYIREMREYWLETRGSGIPGTMAFIPDNFDKKMGEYYDRNIDTKGVSNETISNKSST